MKQNSSTIDYYDQNADSFFNDTVGLDMSLLYAEYEKHLEPNTMILDAGCGSGRDSLYFLSKGFDVVAIDASTQLVAKARELTGLPVAHIKFNDLNYCEDFDGIWASASLLHVSIDEMPSVLNRFSEALKPNGILYASYKYGEHEGMRRGRFFADYNEDKMNILLEALPSYDLVKMWSTEDVRSKRSDHDWLNVLLKKKTKS